MRSADIRSVGWTNNDMSNPTAFRRSLTSVSLNNKFNGRELISVSVQEVNDNPSKVGVRDDKPWAAAKLFGSISLISAVPPSWMIPRSWPCSFRRTTNTRPQGTRLIINST